ncbi:MAG: CapA family protein [Candidatus Margulisbacteria bacterium]|jgi:poly-gamma-glutamate capsule biosynthesis protein CapA/YwtB (metallophosphatase superfamily)|nr:CapA family protein [Candidatus Margulisiibacteriota bacterium]
MKIPRKYLTLTVLAVLLYGLFLRLFLVSVPLLCVADQSSEFYDLRAAELQKIADGEISLIILKDWRGRIRRSGVAAGDVIVADDLPELRRFLRDKPDALALVPWHYADISWRTLRLDGLYFWENPREYPWRLSVWRWDKQPRFDARRIKNITIGGTVVLSRGIGNVIDMTGDVNYPWQGITPVFRAADLSIVNLKSPLVYNYSKPKDRLKLYGQARYAESLRQAGIDFVSVAGNHIGDAGAIGIRDTLDALDKLQIQYTGVAQELADAYEPCFVQLGELRVAFLAVNSVGPNYYRDTDLRGTEIVYHVASFLRERLAQAITKARAADLVIVMCNWGDEYTAQPNKFQQTWGEWLAAQNVQIVAGDQAHWVQRADFRGGTAISYGLGNLIFDQTWSGDTREGVITRYFVYDKKLAAVDILPVFLNDQWYTEINTDRAKIIKMLGRMFN